MSDEIFKQSYEASEPDQNFQTPRKGDTVFCASVTEVPIIGNVKGVGADGTVSVRICDLVRLKTRADNVQVIFRPRRENT